MGIFKYTGILFLLLISIQSASYAQNPEGSITHSSPGYPNEVQFGVNNFARTTVFELPNGTTRFFVPGQKDAKRVFLSGNFNSWSTLKGVMLKTDSGWIRDEHLEPAGVFEYKYIINGNWTIDVNNNLKQNDGAGNTNSVYYRYNFIFKLPGYTNAHRVTVAGDFNKWNDNQLIMHLVAGSWELKLYLHDGGHQYHFLVDGHIVVDPAAKTNKDAAGNPESVLNLGEPINFKLTGYERAQQVFVAGDFNKWKTNELPLKKENGVWTLPLILPAGNYQYKFIVDGGWITDPGNPHRAHGEGQLNSFLSVKPNYTFHLKGHDDAKKVILSGSFNDWNQDGYTMAHIGDEWTISLNLKPGKYLYKFIIDGNWIIDPTNKLWEQNAPRTGNSVLWID